MLISFYQCKFGIDAIGSKINEFLKRSTICAIPILFAGIVTAAVAAPNTFTVDSGTIHETFNNPTYDTFDITPPFQNDPDNPPAVFILGSRDGSNSCEVRLQDVQHDSFQAVCAEDSSWDGEHVAVPVQYAVVAQGVQTIPTNNGGSVTFEVGCVDTNRVQHNCTTGCDTEDWEDIVFASSFTNPAVIANIQTTNNVNPPGPPTVGVDPMLSVAIGGITSSGFELALDLNKENNAGTLAQERVCWMAVEQTSACDLSGSGGADSSLNFSSLGGPSSVPFEAIVTGEVVDGWGNGGNNGCNAGEGASFTSGCFNSTPIAVATKRSRNEAEGWLRYCTLNSGELRVTIDEQRVSGQNRNHVDESISVVAFGSSFTTPVTLSYFESEQAVAGSKKMKFKWYTEAESFNLGFNLWGEVQGEWVQLNKSMIPANSVNVGGSTTYKKNIIIPKAFRGLISNVGVSSVDHSGVEEFFGPFEVNESHGELTTMEPIDWTEVREEFKQSMLDKGYVLLNGRWRKGKSAARKAVIADYSIGLEAIEITARQSGIYKLSYEELAESSAILEAAPVDQIALSYLGEPVARIVESENDIFDAGDSIVFYAKPLTDDVAFYTQDSVFRLYSDSSSKGLDVINAADVASLVEDNNVVSTHYFESYRIDENRFFLQLGDGTDPWLNTFLYAANSSSTKHFDLDVTKPLAEYPATISLELLGGIDFPDHGDDAPDHHIQVLVNGHLVLDRDYDGVTNITLSALVPFEVLEQGQNRVSLVLPADTGFSADVQYLNSLELSVAHPSQLMADGLVIPEQPSVDVYKVQVAQTVTDLKAYSFQENGNFSSLPLTISELENDGDPAQVQRFALIPSLATRHSEPVNYVLKSAESYLAPASIDVVSMEKLLDDAKTNTDYWVITHPSFNNADLERFIVHKTDLGFNVSVANWDDIVNVYGHGMPLPDAINAFLKDARKRSKFKYVLLVGGHTYDYNDYEGKGSITFIPSASVTVARKYSFSNSDTPLADLTGDGLPNVAIGRWPVRDAQDLTSIVNKTITWEQSGNAYSHNMLFVADELDAARSQNYQQKLVDILQAVDLSPSSPNVNTLYMDDYVNNQSETPYADAKQDLLGYFDESAQIGLTVFNGHSSASRWTYRNLLNAADIANFSNVDSPTFVMPLACFTTRYDATVENTLAHQFLFANDAGAVALSGPMFLSEYRENALFGGKLLDKIQTSGSTSVGDLILKLKKGLKPWNDMVNNWAYLGDPSLKLKN